MSLWRVTETFPIACQLRFKVLCPALYVFGLALCVFGPFLFALRDFLGIASSAAPGNK